MYATATSSVGYSRKTIVKTVVNNIIKLLLYFGDAKSTNSLVFRGYYKHLLTGAPGIL